MEWVEFTAKSIDEAKALALEELGVAEEEAEIEILDEPKQGLFGRIRGEARLRARIRPAQVRAKNERRRGGRRDGAAADGESTRPPRGPKNGGSRAPRQRSTESVVDNCADEQPTSTKADAAERPSAATSEVSSVSVDRVGAEAVLFMDGLVAAFGVDGRSEVKIDGAEIEVLVTGADLGLLVGPRGTTLQAIQDLARVASQRRLGDQETRLRVDIGGYRERRRVALSQFAHKMAEEVVASGTARVLEPMGSADRKVIHDTLATIEGVETRSEGDDPHRRVVIAATR